MAAMSASRRASAVAALSTSAISAALSGICQSSRLAISGPYQAAAPVCSGGSSNDMRYVSQGKRGANRSTSLLDSRELSVALTSAARMPGSSALWPASGTTT